MRANAHYRHSRVTFVAPGTYTDPRRTQILGCTTTSKDGNSGSCTGYSDGGWMLYVVIRCSCVANFCRRCCCWPWHIRNRDSTVQAGSVGC